MSIRPTAIVAAAAAALAATLMTGPAASASRQHPAMNWSASWTSAMQQPTPSTPAMGENWSMAGFAKQTVRQEVRVSGGGNVARIRLSNLYGTGRCAWQAPPSPSPLAARQPSPARCVP